MDRFIHPGFLPGIGGITRAGGVHGIRIIGMSIMVTGIIIIIGMAGGIGVPLTIILIVTTQVTGPAEGIRVW